MSELTFGADRRGVSTPVVHALTLGITAILVILLVGTRVRSSPIRRSSRPETS
ncbi:hypothetical protein GJ629_04400 [Halapricum sp. CBA1109]|uniref:hypothetical protein n=1 Tax=Halapricum sp. CBA1109 TaxID=2668068 RepID=UPI0012F871E0|nr:hypothetical protein [Halapricum sp. CBA1109]MUV89231.1 hypothetical protein [Halapricum sp. CBA1109]